MIRRSPYIALAAILLSLLLHALGVNVIWRDPPTQSVEETSGEELEAGSDFADIAEALPTPEPPDPAQSPEPPPEVAAETSPEPLPEEIPSSQALVASDNPQNVLTPDTGSSEQAAAETLGDTTPEESSAPGPETSEQPGSETAEPTVATTAEAELAATISEAAQGAPDGASDDIPQTVEEAAETEEIAALSAPSETSRTPDLALDPLQPLPLDAIDPALPEITVEAEPDAPESSEDAEDTRLASAAVARSLRPPKERPKGVLEGTSRFGDVAQSPRPVIESPLAAYKRSGVDLISRGVGGSRSSGLGAADSRGPGNAGTTNYTGRILVQLNRAPVVYASARGMARVYFEIRPDGSLAWVRVITSSGSQDIDQAARAQVRRAAPFPRPPQGKSQRMVFVYRNR